LIIALIQFMEGYIGLDYESDGVWRWRTGVVQPADVGQNGWPQGEPERPVRDNWNCVFYTSGIFDRGSSPCDREGVHSICFRPYAQMFF